MKISITSMTLADLLKDSFSYEACEEIERILEEEEEEECGKFYKAPTLGDIVIRFCEIDADRAEEEEDYIHAYLSNGKVLIEK